MSTPKVSKKIQSLEGNTVGLMYLKDGYMVEVWWDYDDHLYHIQAGQIMGNSFDRQEQFETLAEIETVMREYQPDLRFWRRRPYIG